MNHHLPPVIIHEVLDYLPMSEQAGQFLTQRGEWKKLKELCNDGEGIKIGIGDTGVDQTHLQGDLSGVVNAKDFTGSRYGYHDRHAHGSHTTGHIGARTDGNGMIGIASKADLVHAKVLGDNGSGSTRGIANGIRWMVDEGCHIINLSLGGGYSGDIEGACREAVEQGVMVNASMGNSGLRGDGHPGNSRYTFGITAVDFNKRIASFSSRSQMAKYAGYGVQVLSCGTSGKYVRMSGTSMSCPDFCGICGLILGFMKKYNLALPRTMEEWEAILLPGVEDLGTPGLDVEYGHGFVNIWKVLEAIASTPSPTPSPESFMGLVLAGRELFMISDSLDGKGSVEINTGTKLLTGTVG